MMYGEQRGGKDTGGGTGGERGREEVVRRYGIKRGGEGGREDEDMRSTDGKWR